jgi:hypothetical protein
MNYELFSQLTDETNIGINSIFIFAKNRRS